MAGGGGNGGAGSGGAIFIRVDGFATVAVGESGETALLQAVAGIANLPPTSYVGNGHNGGGAASAGRIRIEGPVGINMAHFDCDNLNPNGFGICPAPSLSVFESAATTTSRAHSRPYRVSVDGVQSLRHRFGNPLIEYGSLPPGNFVRVLFSGAQESREIAGAPAEFGAGVDDVSLLVDAEFIRMDIHLFSEGSNVTTINSVELPVLLENP